MQTENPENLYRTSHPEWVREYDELMGISMEYSDEIPLAAVLFSKMSEKMNKGFKPLDILDIGCGKGRIGLHLAKQGHAVTGIDFVPSALNEFKKTARNLSLAHRIKTVEQNLEETWPFADSSFDAAFAITIFESFISEQQMIHFKFQLNRILKPGALFAAEFYLPEDGYYREFIIASTGREKHLAYDPHNKLYFRLYERSEIIDLFHDCYELLSEQRCFFKSNKYGKEYERTSQVLIMRKSDHS